MGIHKKNRRNIRRIEPRAVIYVNNILHRIYGKRKFYQKGKGEIVRVGIHQPMYLPWLGLFDRIYKCDQFILLDNVPYSKNYFINRNKIKSPREWQWLTVPVLMKGNFGQPIKDVRIDNSTDWAKKHWLSIYHLYNKAPYFLKYSDFFEDVYKKKWDYLIDLLEHLLKYLLVALKIDTPIKKASSLAIEGQKEELILNICKTLGANEYLSGPDGRNYLRLTEWETHNINVIFHDYRHPEYPQLYEKFIPEMSIIDLLFNCGPKSLSILKNEDK